jgi:hypothetical protein
VKDAFQFDEYLTTASSRLKRDSLSKLGTFEALFPQLREVQV